MFDPKSRYRDVETYQMVDRRGRVIAVVATPPPSEESLLGYHVLKEGQRLDLLAHRYLENATGFWRICELNESMLAESLTEAAEIAIPTKRT